MLLFKKKLSVAFYSKCLPRGSFRIGMNVPDSIKALQNFDIAAFQTPQDKKVVIAVNRYSGLFFLNFDSLKHTNSSETCH